MARKRDHDNPPDADVASPRTKKTRRSSPLFWLVSRLLVLVILLGALAFFAPILIARSGLWKTVLAVAAPKLSGKIDATSLQLSWLTPIEVQGLVVRDPAGQTLVEVPLIRTQKSLLDLALRQNDLGLVEIRDFKAHVVLRPDGSNAEDFLAALPKSESKAPPPGFMLSLTGGSIEFDDQVARRQWLLEGLTADVDWSDGANHSKTGKFAAILKSLAPPPSNSGTGQMAAEFTWQPPPPSAGKMGAGQGQLALQNVPTEILQGALRRFIGDIRSRGPLTLQAAGSWADESNSQRVSITSLATSGLIISAPQYLGLDQPTISIAAGQADVQLTGGQIAVRDLKLESNLMQLAGQASAATATAPLSASDIQLTGQLNLAELARQLPNTLRLRDGTAISSGQLQVTLLSRGAANARTWEGDLRTANLRATSAGRPLRFDQPLAVSFLVQQTPSGPAIERLTGRASFLELDGRGTLSEGSITARTDLDKLVTELNQLIDWGSTKLAGTTEAKLHWTRGKGDRWNATADAAVKGFELTAPRLAPWREPNLVLTAQAEGLIQNESLTQIETAKLAIEAAADRLDAELLEPVKSPAASSIWPVKLGLQGDLATWAPRLQPFLSLGDWRLAGAIRAAGSGRFSPQSSELAPTTIQIEQLAVEGPNVSIREPVLKIETAGAWDSAQRALTLGNLTVASSAVAFRADGLRLIASSQPSVVGMIDFRGDLARLTSWLKSDKPPGQPPMAGALTGRVEIGYRGQSLAAKWTTDIENLVVVTAPPASSARAALASASTPLAEALWQEPRINLSGQGSFDPATSSLAVERMSLTAANAGLTAVGGIKKLSTAPEVDLSGEIAYSLEGLTQQLRSREASRGPKAGQALPFGLDTLQLAGKEKRQFVLKGPLFAATGDLTGGQSRTAGQTSSISTQLTGEASLGWKAAQYVGLIAGPADFRARLAGGVVQIGPLDIPVSEGRLTTAPQLFLNAQHPLLVMDRGPLIQNVRISPEMCTLWLKFVAPLVAEATRAEGTFSLSLNGATVPLVAPIQSNLAGTLAIQSAQIGPGPAAQPILNMARQLRTFFDANAGAATAVDPDRGWLQLPKQDVMFEIHDGAVHHRGMTMTIRDVVVTTEGSVGIETQELNLTATVPIQDSWFKQDSRFAMLKGKTLQIPIRGTLKQPKIDAKVIETLGRQLAGSALDKLLDKPQDLLQKGFGGGISKGLDRLFGPQPQPGQPAPAPR
jgi:hypothetical protein